MVVEASSRSVQQLSETAVIREKLNSYLLIENMPRTSDCVIDLTEDDESSSSLPLFSMNAINEAKIAKFSANSDVASDDDEIIIENIIYRDKPGNKPGDKPLTFEKQPQKQQSVLKKTSKNVVPISGNDFEDMILARVSDNLINKSIVGHKYSKTKETIKYYELMEKEVDQSIKLVHSLLKAIEDLPRKPINTIKKVRNVST